MTRFVRHAIPSVVEVTPQRFGDHRGYLSEAWKRAAFEAEGLHFDWVQDNHSLSATPGTVRGLHFQVPPTPQAKLVRVIAGAAFDVAVDLRAGSPHYGQAVAVTLTADLGNQLLVPAGFAHGFMTLTPDTQVLYKIDAPWSKADERAIAWDDPDIAIAWPLDVPPVLSEKDADAMALADFVSPFAYTGD